MTEANELLSQFEKAAVKYDLLRLNGTAKQMNAQFDLMTRIIGELAQLNKLDVLKSILTNDSEAVRFFVSSMILGAFPAEAETVLIDIANSKGFYAFNAKITLKEWRKGNLKFDYYKK